MAIIGVLVAISIPIFTGQLAKARRATDAANIRSGYAEAASEVLLADPEPDDGAEYYLHADGTISTTNSDLYACKGSATAADKITIATSENLAWTAKDTISYVYHKAVTGTNAKEAYLEIKVTAVAD